MKPFSKFTIAYIVCSAALFMAGTTLLPAAGIGGLGRDVVMVSLCGAVLYALLTVQSVRRDAENTAEAADAEPFPAPQAQPQMARAVRDQADPLKRAA